MLPGLRPSPAPRRSASEGRPPKGKATPTSVQRPAEGGAGDKPGSVPPVSHRGRVGARHCPRGWVTLASKVDTVPVTRSGQEAHEASLWVEGSAPLRRGPQGMLGGARGCGPRDPPPLRPLFSRIVVIAVRVRGSGVVPVPPGSGQGASPEVRGDLAPQRLAGSQGERGGGGTRWPPRTSAAANSSPLSEPPFPSSRENDGRGPSPPAPGGDGCSLRSHPPACIPARRAPSPALTTLNPRSVLSPPARHRGMEPPMGPSGSARRRLQVDPREHVAAKRFKR